MPPATRARSSADIPPPAVRPASPTARSVLSAVKTVIRAPHTPGKVVKEILPDDFEENKDHDYCCIGRYYCQVCGELVYTELFDHEPDEPIYVHLEGNIWREIIPCKSCGRAIQVIENVELPEPTEETTPEESVPEDSVSEEEASAEDAPEEQNPETDTAEKAAPETDDCG